MKSDNAEAHHSLSSGKGVPMDEVKKLIKELGDQDDAVRVNAVGALVQIGEPAVKALVKGLRNDDWKVRFGALEALGKIGDAWSVELLLPLLGDWSDNVINQAIEALVQIGEPAVESLIKGLGNDDWSVQVGVIKALGKIGDSRAVEPLTKALGDENGNVRLQAAKVLIRMGEPEVEVLSKVGEPEVVKLFIRTLGD